MLVTAIAFVATRISPVWQEEAWKLPQPGKAKPVVPAEEPRKELVLAQPAGTRNIIDKNLFDPERGANKTKEAEASALAAEKIRRLVLVGTVILGDSRYAILKEPSDFRPGPPGAQKNPSSHLRLKLGDAVENFKVTEIEDRRVVLTKGAAKVEIAINFFSNPDTLKAGPGPIRSAFGQPAPRRDSLPPPPLSR